MLPRSFPVLCRVVMLCMIALVCVPEVGAQGAEEAPPVRVVLADGSRHVGHIEREDDTEIVFRTLGGVTMTIPRAQIVRIEPAELVRRGETVLRTDPNATRLLFAPTARALQSGEGYVALYQVFLPFVAVGVSDAVALAGGFSLLPGVSEQLVYAAPKVTPYQRGDLAVAVGAFAATITSSDGGVGGIVYAVGTKGGPSAAVSFGAGFLFGGGDFIETPILLIGGEYQVSNNVKLLSENYVIPAADNLAIVSGGIRFIGDRLAGDFGLFTSPEIITEGGLPFFPWLSFAYNFGQ